MTNWILSVEVDGEWETCGFATRKEAFATFVALAKDYNEALKTAVLTAKPKPEDTERSGSPPESSYIN